MSKKNLITATLSINGKKVKQIVRLDKEGNQKWTKFSPIEQEGLGHGFHFFPKNKIEHNHIEVYLDGTESKKDKEYRQDIRPAGIVMVTTSTGEKKFVNLPPLIVSEEELKKPMTDKEIIENFLKKVRVINPDR